MQIHLVPKPFWCRLTLLGLLCLTLGGVLSAQTGSWTVRNVRGTGFLWAITASGTRLAAVGTEGRIVSSDDGVTWVARNSGVTDWLVGVTYGSNRFVAVGDNGRILTSPDGTTWTTVSGVPTTARLNNVIYAGQRFVAVGEQGTVVVSSDGGVTWQIGTTGVSGWLRGLTFLTTRSYLFAPFGGGTSGLSSIRSVSEAAFVASGQGGAMITSVDGLAWQPMPSGTTDDLEALVSVRGQGGYGIFVPSAAITIGASGVARSYQAPTSYFTGNVLTGYTGPPPTLPEFAAWKNYISGAPAGIRLRGLMRGADGFSAIIVMSGENGAVLVNGRPETTGITQNLVAGVYFRDKFYVVGEDEVILQSNPAYTSKLINLATRGSAAGTRGTLIGGTVVTGSTSKRLLIRAVGPSLGAFGLSGALSRPTLTVYNSVGTAVVSNSGWNNLSEIATAAAATGAFPLADANDAAAVVTLPPGAYTIHVNSAEPNVSGLGLMEIYDADPPSSIGPRLANVSTRGYVGAGAEVLIGGFVISGSSGKNVLVRGIGPGLRSFGVGAVVEDPVLTIFRGASIFATNDNWGEDSPSARIVLTSQQVGAFEVAESSLDAALVLYDLPPGAYTAQLSGRDGATGEGLLEIYELP